LKILFLPFESDEAQLLARLAQRLKARGHAVHIASVDHYTVTHTRGEVFDCYRKVGLTEGKEFSHLGEFYATLNQTPADLSEDGVDWQHLRSFEEKYCKRLTLLELAALDPIISGAFHHREIYHRPKNKFIFFKFLELMSKWLERLFAEHDFDAVITLNYQYFVKATAFAIADTKGIPYLAVSSCRISDLHVIYDNFSLGTPRYVVEEMARLEKVGDECADAAKYAEWLKAERRPAYTEFEHTLASIAMQMPIKNRLRHLMWLTTRYPKSVLLINKHYRGWFRPDYFLPSYLAILWGEIVGLARRIGYFRHKELTSRDLPKRPFVFFPLHLIPENSVLTLSRTINELECLFQMSKVLPPDWKIAVKINPNMLTTFDTHPNRYYLEMSKLPNVVFLDPRIRSGEVIGQASAVATISGTALLEGAIFGKPGFRWGRTEFEVVDMIHEFDPECVREHLEKKESRNLKYYIQACFNLGIRLDIRLIGRSLARALPPEQEGECLRQLAALEESVVAFLDGRRSSNA
jgi:hypothetical protein